MVKAVPASENMYCCSMSFSSCGLHACMCSFTFVFHMLANDDEISILRATVSYIYSWIQKVNE